MRALAESLLAKSHPHRAQFAPPGWRLHVEPGEVMLVWTKRW